MNKPRAQGLVLAVHPTSRGFGWVLFESPLSPIDWGMASAKTGRNARLMARFERLLSRYEPLVLVLEQFEGRPSQRRERVQHLCRAMIHLAHTRGIGASVYSRAAINTCFASIGATTRREIALAVAQHIEVFRRRLPPEQKPWIGEDARHSLFDAAALAITHFAVRGGRSAEHPP